MSDEKASASGENRGGELSNWKTKQRGNNRTKSPSESSRCPSSFCPFFLDSSWNQSRWTHSDRVVI